MKRDMMSQDDQDFIRGIHESPNDDTARLIYADWLEDRGDSRAEYLRLECEIASLEKDDALFKELLPRITTLRKNVDVRWLAAIGRTRIGNCGSFAFKCPKRWENLKKTGSSRVRYCEDCEQPVYYAQTPEEVHEHAMQHRCIAIDTSLKMVSSDWVKLKEEAGDDGILMGDVVEPSF